MSAPKDGGAAFPQHLFTEGMGGMSLRDWFAGMALQGAVAYVNEHKDHYGESLAHTAIAAYKIADAMLTCRDGKEGA
jgi:hypothetical protein